MSRLDRYIFKQCLAVFAFFTLIFTLVMWINRAVILFDELVTDGHSAGVFLEFSVLALPTVLSLVLPVSAFAATVYVTSRLSNESELAVIQATGMSPWRLARPIFMFGILVGLFMLSLTTYFVPTTGTMTKDREFELSQSLGAKFLREGSFEHPMRGVTFFIRDITPEGELKDVFLSDRREAETSYTYTSERAFLVQTNDQTIFVMQNGLMQSHNRVEDTLSLTQFDELYYDLTGTFSAARKARPRLYYLPTPLLWQDPQAAADLSGQSLSRVSEEFHSRIQFAILCLVSSMIGFAALYAAGFSRFGSGRFIIFAILLLVIIKLVESAVTEPTKNQIENWPLVYAPSLVGLIMFWIIMYVAVHPGMFRKTSQKSEQST